MANNNNTPATQRRLSASSAMDPNNINDFKSMAAFFTEQIQNIPNKEYMDGRLGRIEEKHNQHARELNGLRERVESLEKKAVPTWPRPNQVSAPDTARV